MIRKRVEHAIRNSGMPQRELFYLPSLSARTMIYKGMLSANQVEPMFPDIVEPDFASALVLVHQRFSTNTFPSWPLAHPYRMVAHNGETRAFPVRQMAYHHIANLSVAGVPYLVTY